MMLVPYVSFGTPFTSNVYMLTQVRVPLYNWKNDTMNWYIYIWYEQSSFNFFYSYFGEKSIILFLEDGFFYFRLCFWIFFRIV
jgi:hypothetical protein